MVRGLDVWLEYIVERRHTAPGLSARVETSSSTKLYPDTDAAPIIWIFVHVRFLHASVDL